MLVTHVLCKICANVTRKNFLFLCLILFVNMLIGKKVTSPMFGVPKGTFYYTKDYQHAKNEVFYVFGGGESVLEKVMHGMAHKGLKKIFNLPQIYTYSERENPCLNKKA